MYFNTRIKRVIIDDFAVKTKTTYENKIRALFEG